MQKCVFACVHNLRAVALVSKRRNLCAFCHDWLVGFVFFPLKVFFSDDEEERAKG